MRRHSSRLHGARIIGIHLQVATGWYHGSSGSISGSRERGQTSAVGSSRSSKTNRGVLPHPAVDLSNALLKFANLLSEGCYLPFFDR